MTAIYRALFFVSLSLLIASLYLPPSHGIPIGRRLSGQPESWSLTFSTPDHRLIGATEEQSKKMLLSYLHDHGPGNESFWSGLTAPAIVAAVFSLVAWRRERDFRHRTSGYTEPGDGVSVDNRKPQAPGR